MLSTAMSIRKDSNITPGKFYGDAVKLGWGLDTDNKISDLQRMCFCHALRL
jgi:hypothetical protein